MTEMFQTPAQDDEPTIVETLTDALSALQDERRISADEPSSREFRLAIEHVEDAITRTNRGFGKKLHMFRVGDAEKNARKRRPE